MTITHINCDIERANIARTILESLPDWFGNSEAIEEYIAVSKGQPFFCAFIAIQYNNSQAGLYIPACLLSESQ